MCANSYRRRRRRPAQLLCSIKALDFDLAETLLKLHLAAGLLDEPRMFLFCTASARSRNFFERGNNCSQLRIFSYERIGEREAAVIRARVTARFERGITLVLFPSQPVSPSAPNLNCNPAHPAELRRQLVKRELPWQIQGARRAWRPAESPRVVLTVAGCCCARDRQDPCRFAKFCASGMGCASRPAQSGIKSLR
jgi:hypothetical protein